MIGLVRQSVIRKMKIEFVREPFRDSKARTG